MLNSLLQLDVGYPAADPKKIRDMAPTTLYSGSQFIVFE